MNNNIEDEENPNYNYMNQMSGEQNIEYPQQMPMENNNYNITEEKLPPIYTQQIASIKETNETQVKYLEPIELSDDVDVNKFLKGKLMKQIAPKILQIKQEAQKEGMSNDPLVHTEINFDLKQNDAIFEGHEGENDDKNQDDEEDENIKKSQSGEQTGPGGIKYSSVLPPKYGKVKVINIDQYGNKKIEGGEDEDDDADDLEDKQENVQEQNNYIPQQQQYNLQQEQLRAQEQQQLLLKQKLEQEQIQLQKQIEQEKIRQQQMLIQQQKFKEEQLKQQQLIQQQKLKEEQLKQQQLIQQQRLQYQQQQNLIQNKRPTVPNQNFYPYMRANSENIGSMNNFNPNMINNTPLNIKTVKINDQFKNNTIPTKQIKKKDPIVQKAIKIYGTLRPRTQKEQPLEPVQTPMPIKSVQKFPSNNEFMAAKMIQNNWRNHFIRNRFNQIKPQLELESQSFLKQQYDICDKAGPVASDADFNPEGWKRYYPLQDPFFNFNKGFVLPYGIKIKHPNDPLRVSVYEGDININNERHGFGRMTTVKSVILGQWRNGAFTGWGRETRRSGKVYEGKYINGLLQGKGILKNNKGVTYIGDFVDSKRHGKGILDTHKVHYEGEFKNDKLSGKGRIIFKIEGHVYEGEFDNNEINGFGTFKWKNGDSYTGNMLNGKMHGKGKYRYNNGVVYEGVYNNGIKQGKGKIYNTNGVTNSEIQRNINQNNNAQKINISGVSNISKFSGNK